jgi:hypothetical protein
MKLNPYVCFHTHGRWFFIHHTADGTVIDSWMIGNKKDAMEQVATFGAILYETRGRCIGTVEGVKPRRRPRRTSKKAKTKNTASKQAEGYRGV